MTTILITGGAGSLGTSLVNELQKEENNKIRVFDNNEHALATMKTIHTSKIRKLYGNIVDKERMRSAVRGVDIVIHCAALKNLEITEYNTSELIKTNIIGTDNVLSTSVEADVKKIMFISSDKAVEPTSIYGSSKLMGEHASLNYNQMNSPLSRVSVFRSGNFMNSNGNVLEVWKKQIELGQPLTITDQKCLRYFVPTSVAAKTILKCIDKMTGGEIFVPNEDIMPEKSILSMAKRFLYENNSVYFDTGFNFIGLRKGEKLSELLFNQEELSRRTHDPELNCWVIR